jgi:hypothetical protein
LIVAAAQQLNYVILVNVVALQTFAATKTISKLLPFCFLDKSHNAATIVVCQMLLGVQYHKTFNDRNLLIFVIS